MSRAVTVMNEESRLVLDSGTVTACVGALDSLPGYTVAAGQIEVAFVDPETCSRLHESFFADPEITDVMTFPGDPEDDQAGSIAICPQVAFQACKDHSTSLNEELTLYLVHAWLHLAGRRDDSVDAQAEMRRSEGICLTYLRERGICISANWDVSG